MDSMSFENFDSPGSKIYECFSGDSKQEYAAHGDRASREPGQQCVMLACGDDRRDAADMQRRSRSEETERVRAGAADSGSSSPCA